MKIKTMLLAGLLTVGSFATVTTITAAQMSTSRHVPVKLALQCRNYGGQQDVSKNPDIINSSKLTIQSGKTVYWQASDGDKGSVTLNKALPPGGKVGVNGKPGQSYTCSAWVVQ